MIWLTSWAITNGKRDYWRSSVACDGIILADSHKALQDDLGKMIEQWCVWALKKSLNVTKWQVVMHWPWKSVISSVFGTSVPLWEHYTYLGLPNTGILDLNAIMGEAREGNQYLPRNETIPDATNQSCCDPSSNGTRSWSQFYFLMWAAWDVLDMDDAIQFVIDHGSWTSSDDPLITTQNWLWRNKYTKKKH